MGIRKARRLGKGRDLLYLLRLPAGQTTLPHGHNGVEFTTVLKGAYKDGDEIYAAGDFCELDASCDHQPQVTTDAECVCMIASERPMRMTTRLGRLVQALTGV
jgi:putative transcriptional regulator